MPRTGCEKIVIAGGRHTDEGWVTLYQGITKHLQVRCLDCGWCSPYMIAPRMVKIIHQAPQLDTDEGLACREMFELHKLSSAARLIGNCCRCDQRGTHVITDFRLAPDSRGFHYLACDDHALELTSEARRLGISRAVSRA